MNSRHKQDSDEEGGIERIHEKLDDVERELASIREAIGDIREDLAWWLKNNRKDDWQVIQPITSMPTDPLAPDWAERLNRYSRHDVMETEPAPPPPAATLARPEGPPGFCCDVPDLQWRGDPHCPGVACRSCGYTVADCGSVVMQPADEKSPPAALKPTCHQQALFAEE